MTTVDLGQRVNRVSSAMQPMLLKNGNRLRVTFAGEPHVTIDEGKIFHIVLNLVSNACKFTKNGEIHVHVECRSDRLSITVTDNGIGIPRDRQKLIFEPFQQADMGDTREHGGVGLGLAITKRFCEMLGGSIDVQSEEHVGSTFRVTIPLPMETRRE